MENVISGKRLLWLDDLRQPYDIVNGKTWVDTYSPIPQPFEVIWVKKYHEFVSWITTNGLPDVILFDHDLSDIHINKSTYKEMTGMDCAKWLVDYCIDNKLKLPLYNIQSANTCGKDNIDGLLKSFIKHG